jgi:hypothetical protein
MLFFLLHLCLLYLILRRDFRLSPLCNCGLLPRGVLCGVGWHFVTYVWGQPFGPTFMCGMGEDGTVRFFSLRFRRVRKFANSDHELRYDRPAATNDAAPNRRIFVNFDV